MTESNNRFDFSASTKLLSTDLVIRLFLVFHCWLFLSQIVNSSHRRDIFLTERTGAMRGIVLGQNRVLIAQWKKQNRNKRDCALTREDETGCLRGNPILGKNIWSPKTPTITIGEKGTMRDSKATTSSSMSSPIGGYNIKNFMYISLSLCISLYNKNDYNYYY